MDKLERLFPVLPCKLALVDKLHFRPWRSAKNSREESFLRSRAPRISSFFGLLGRELDVLTFCLEFPEAQGVPGLSEHRLDKPDAASYHLLPLEYFSTDGRSHNPDPASPTAPQVFLVLNLEQASARHRTKLFDSSARALHLWTTSSVFFRSFPVDLLLSTSYIFAPGEAPNIARRVVSPLKSPADLVLLRSPWSETRCFDLLRRVPSGSGHPRALRASF